MRYPTAPVASPVRPRLALRRWGDAFVLSRSDDPRIRAGLQDAAWDAAAEFGFPYLVAPLVMSRERFQDLQRRERLLARDILNEGIPA